MKNRFAPTALMLGNFVTGMSVLAPVGMLNDLARDLNVGVSDAGLLITFGAIVLCIASPATAWLTSRIDRRLLLSGALLVATVGHLASAFAPNYSVLLIIRLLMLAVVALFTPQAAATAAMISPIERRGSTMTYVFMGWSLSVAVGLPLATYVAEHFGWRGAYAGIAALGLVSFALVAWSLPHGLKGVPVELKTWMALGRNPLVLTLLAITATQLAGQQELLTFLAPLARRTQSTEAVAALFAVFGIMSLAGNFLASRFVDTWGVWQTSLAFTCSMLLGIFVWTLSDGVMALIFAGVGFWGFGFAAANSMQQVRLVSASPQLSSASVSLNTSMVYVGQGVGSAIASVLYKRELLHTIDDVALAFLVVAIALIIWTKPRKA